MLYMNHSTIPPTIETFSHACPMLLFTDLLAYVRYYKPSKDLSSVISTRTGVADVTHSTVVQLRGAVPYGAAQICISLYSGGISLS
jgi:hypothetical protein